VLAVYAYNVIVSLHCSTSAINSGVSFIKSSSLSSSSSDRVDSRGPLRQPRVATTTSLGPFGNPGAVRLPHHGYRVEWSFLLPSFGPGRTGSAVGQKKHTRTLPLMNGSIPNVPLPLSHRWILMYISLFRWRRHGLVSWHWAFEWRLKLAMLQSRHRTCWHFSVDRW